MKRDVGDISGPHPTLTKESLSTRGNGNKILLLLFGPVPSYRSMWMAIKERMHLTLQRRLDGTQGWDV
jgi:hypothetical protein